MKNKGVIFSIILIMCFGVFITVNTRRLISVGTVTESTAPAADTLAESEDGNAEKLLTKTAVSEDAGGFADNKTSKVMISPLTGTQNTGEKENTSALSKEDYAKKFPELDTQIKKMKDSGVAPNTDSYKNMADYEYRLWDSELNAIYQDILKCMTQEEAEALRAEEREWMKQRDITAKKAISKYKGGTIESLEYMASLADSTRTRTYKLLEDYGSCLQGTEDTINN